MRYSLSPIKRTVLSHNCQEYILFAIFWFLYLSKIKKRVNLLPLYLLLWLSTLAFLASSVKLLYYNLK